MKKLNINKNAIGRLGRIYFDRQVNRIISVLVILLFVLIVKIINTNTTNYIVHTIEKNIYYKFNIREDGVKVKDYLKKTVDSYKVAIEGLTKEIINNEK